MVWRKYTLSTSATPISVPVAFYYHHIYIIPSYRISEYQFCYKAGNRTILKSQRSKQNYYIFHGSHANHRIATCRIAAIFSSRYLNPRFDNRSSTKASWTSVSAPIAFAYGSLRPLQGLIYISNRWFEYLRFGCTPSGPGS